MSLHIGRMSEIHCKSITNNPDFQMQSPSPCHVWQNSNWRCLICSQEASLAAVISSGRVSTRSMSSWCTGALVPRVVSKSVASPQRPWRFQWLDRPDSISQLAGWLKMNRNGHMHNSIFILHHWSVSILHSLFHFMKPFHSLWKVKCHLVPMGHVGRCHKGDTLSCKKHSKHRRLSWPRNSAQSGYVAVTAETICSIRCPALFTISMAASAYEQLCKFYMMYTHVCFMCIWCMYIYIYMWNMYAMNVYV